MLATLLYLFTGLATALPVLRALEWAVWGAPTMRIEYISLVGSLVLVFAAVASVLRRHRLATWLALLGSLAVWCFYTPLLAGAVWAGLIKYSELNLSSFQPTPPESALSIFLVVAFALLVGSTVYAAWASLKRLARPQDL
jgi:hypothetical protein